MRTLAIAAVLLVPCFGQITNRTSGNATALQSRPLAATAPGVNQVVGWDGTTWKPVNQTAAGGVGVAPYSVTITSQTSYTITAVTHGQGAYAQPFCYDNATPRASVSCSYTRASDGQLVFTFSPAFTGQIVVMGSTGGFANPMTTAGDIIIGGASGVATRLAAGTEGYVLKVVSGVPAWAASSGGSPGGSSGQLQYNNAGAFGGLASLTLANAGATNEVLTYYNAVGSGITSLVVKTGASQSTTNPTMTFVGNTGTQIAALYPNADGTDGARLYFGSGTSSGYVGMRTAFGGAVLGYDAFSYMGCGSSSCDLYSGGTLQLRANQTNIFINKPIKWGGTNSTGSGSAALGSNSPAVTNTAPYTWITVTTSDGSTGYMPVWK